MTLIVVCAILIVLLVSGVPVPFSFGGAILYLIYTLGTDPYALFASSYTQLSSFNLLAIPLFILAGGIMEEGKIGEALINWVYTFVGRVKGGLACVTTIACAVFGSICGSGAATLSCIGSIMAPQMRDKKYPVGLSAAVACCAAPLGLLIPPSAMQILVAWILNISVLACFLSTVVPGIILTILMCVCSVFMLRNEKDIVTEEKLSLTEWKRLFTARTKTAAPSLLMPVLILGGIYSGIMTATESAGVAVIYAVPVAMLIYKSMSLKELSKCIRTAATTTGVVMCMIGIVIMMSRLLTQANMPQSIMHLMLGISDNKYVLLLMINIFLILLGMIMDDASATLLAAPILFPVITRMGVSPYQFAALLGVNIGMGNITPPSAPFLYLAARIYGTDTGKVIKPAIFLMIFAYLPTLVFVSLFPDVSLWLPRLVLGGKLNI